MKEKEYIEKVYPFAEEVKQRYNIAKIISITQSAHESNFGRSELARQANNLFGIKATESWVKKGGKVWLGKTWEVIDGKKIDLKDAFRMYDSWRESFLDWAELISSLGIYKEAYKFAQLGLVEDYGDAITGIYATDPKYKYKLVHLSGYVRRLAEELGYEV